MSSHIIKDAQVTIMDLEALGPACAALGLSLRRGKTTYRVWDKIIGNCAHAIVRRPGDLYDVGIVERKGGGWKLKCSGKNIPGAPKPGLLDNVGKGFSRLLNEYARQAFLDAARAGGRKLISEKELPGGGVVLRCSTPPMHSRAYMAGEPPFSMQVRDGLFRCVYQDSMWPVFDRLVPHLCSVLQRGGSIDFSQEDKWVVNLSAVDGPCLGPYDTYREATTCLHGWHENNLLASER